MLLIRGGRVIDPKTGLDDFLDLVIDGSRIARIGKALAGVYDELLDASGKIVVPGLIDVHVHFRDPGLTHKEDMRSGAAAALRGGFTTVVCMANTVPPVDNGVTLAEVQRKAAAAPINIKTVAALSRGLAGAELTDMAALKKQGAVGFSDDGAALQDAAFLRRAMLAAKEADAPISLHEEDSSLIGVGGVNDGAVSAALGLCGALPVSESSMVARDCMIALDTGARVHFQHISCAESVAALRMAKALGANVSAEATPHHFSLSEEAVLHCGTLAKVNPPLRTEKARLAIIEGLRDGTIDMIASDHAPHSAEEKQRPFACAPSGVTGLETALALGITNLVNAGHLDIVGLIRAMTCAPAALYGFPGGSLAEGAVADITIFDEGVKWTVSDFASKSANSPFIGQTLTGKVKYTICGGKLLYRDDSRTRGENDAQA
jgi:dihydroorotase